jgi:hypothetical protein
MTSLWAMIAAAPVLWFINLESNFAVSPQFCGFGRWMSIAVSIVTLAAAAALAGVARTRLRTAPDQAMNALAAGAAIINTVAAAVILAQSIPILLLARCG